MKRWAFVLVAVQVVLALGLPPRRAAAGGVTFTVATTSAYLRAQPNPSATPTYSVFKGQHYAVTGRSADSEWLTLDYAGATQGTWIRASYGTLAGPLGSAPVVAGDAAPTPRPIALAPVVSAGRGGAAPAQQLTITANSVFARDAPYFESNRLASLFKGQVYPAVARDYSADWVQFQMYGGLAWAPFGAVKLSGELFDLQVADDIPPAAAPATFGGLPSAPPPAWIPVITDQMRAIYYQAPALGRSQRYFAVVGDCNSLSYYYLELVAKNLIDLRGQDYLRATIQQFKTAFYRKSVAVSGGFTSATILDPTWADPRVCRAGESPFACELRITRASIVFIALGTGDQYDWADFEGHYRQMIEFSLANGVLPVVVTKADTLESQEGGAEPGYINNVIRRLAQEYSVPLLDFELATANLPNHGLVDEPGHDFHLNAEAMGEHVIATLETLNAIWQP